MTFRLRFRFRFRLSYLYLTWNWFVLRCWPFINQSSYDQSFGSWQMNYKNASDSDSFHLQTSIDWLMDCILFQWHFRSSLLWQLIFFAYFNSIRYFYLVMYVCMYRMTSLTLQSVSHPFPTVLPVVLPVHLVAVRKISRHQSLSFLLHWVIIIYSANAWFELLTII